MNTLDWHEFIEREVMRSTIEFYEECPQYSHLSADIVAKFKRNSVLRYHTSPVVEPNPEVPTVSQISKGPQRPRRTRRSANADAL